MTTEGPLRRQLAAFIDFGEAHVTCEAALAELDHSLQGTRAAGLPHSPWELLEHMRITQHDILEFCVSSKYEEMKWPDDYWPKSASRSFRKLAALVFHESAAGGAALFGQ